MSAKKPAEPGMIARLLKFVRDENGVTSLEYVLIAAAGSVAAIHVI